MQETLQQVIVNYKCNAETNNSLFRHFTKMTESHDFLLKHRQHIEANKLGFGDRAFHYMWFLVLQHLCKNCANPKLLEIGVYKGQVISLWSLLTKQLDCNTAISCVTPLSGHTGPKSGLSFYFNYLISSKFRADVKAGNFYDNENYYDSIRKLFNAFNLDVNKINLHKGFSNDPGILSQLQNATFDLVYIDGDHTREMVENDIRNYAPKINTGGFLVMDDASCNIPGGENGTYWKGHQSVSDACEIIPSLGFTNVLNVGHNRIYQKG